jgi:hypothetical protein
MKESGVPAGELVCPFRDQEARMPLHVDRTLVQAHQSRGEHVLELAAARARQAAGPDAVAQQDEASPVLRLVGVSGHDSGDVASIEQAEKLVRSLLGGGADKALAAHTPLDADRVSALLAG